MNSKKSIVVFLSSIFFFFFQTFLFSQTIMVYDGSVVGEDTDWWGITTSFSVNWSDNIDWSSYTGDKWYEYDLEINISGDYSSVKTGVVPENPSTSTPPKSVTITGVTLSENRIYRVRIRAYHGSYGIDQLQIGVDSYSDGVTTDFTNPQITTTTVQYNILSNSYSLSWSGSDTNGASNSGIASYDVQYSADQTTWREWRNQVTTTSDTFQASDNNTYHFRVRARDNAGNVSAWSYTDHTPPTAEITGLSSVQTSNTFTVSWTATDTESQIAYYDVQYRVGTGSWTDWKTLSSATSSSFTGNNGQNYSFRVRAYDTAGNRGEWSSENVAMTTINSTSPSISISASPSILSFASTDTSTNLSLQILATGGNITVTSITEKRSYPSWGIEEEPPESVSIDIPGGSTYNLTRTVELSEIQRSKALGSATEGSFTLTYEISGQDTGGNPISATIALPVNVSGGLPSTLQINGVSITLPPSPYYVGDIIQNAQVTIDATGSGSVSGEILVDDESSWSDNPSFSVNVNGTTTFTINGNLPTTSPGEHTVKVEITNPVEVSTEETYTVSSSTPPFPPQTLTLVKDVAELTDLNGTANAMNGDHYIEFTFSGTAKMKVFPLKDDNGNPVVLNNVTVTNLVVRYNEDNPTKAKIRGGSVEKEAEENETLATIGKGYLRVKKISFQGQVSPPTDYLRVDTKLYIPKLGTELFKIGGLILKTGGIEGKAVSVAENKSKTFKAFGMEFAIHDVDAEKAITVGKDKANDRYYFSLSGGISLSEKKGTNKTKKELTTFKGLTFYSDGEVDGTVQFNKSFDIIPNTLTLNKIKIQSEGDSLKMKLKGELKNLPYPLDSLGTTQFEFSFDKDGNAEGYVVPIHELEKNNKGHKLGNSDSTEWDLGVGNLDVTYLALHLIFNEGDFDKDHSEIQIGADIYLNLKNQDDSTPTDDEKRVSFGELNANGDFTGGIRISMDGDLTWHQPTNATIIQNKKLDLAALTIKIDALGIKTDPFKIVFTGGILVGLSGVSGDINFENLEIGLDGTVSNLSDAVTGGMLDVADVVHVEVDDVDWSNSPTSLTFQADATTGQGANRAPQKSDKTVDVESYIRIMGASINIGSTDEPVMSGGFDELTVYKPVSGSRSFVLRNVHVSTSDVELRADIEYASSVLRVAGEVKLPNEITAIAVGKMGSQNGKPTMGIFIAASGLSVTVGPGVFLDEVGGGVFINPLQEDVELVRRIANFKRPELEDDITDKRPGGAENPGSFAVMLLGGVYVAEKDIVKGRALITITANYFNLDAEVECLDGLLDGTAYLAIGWNPAYGEGNVVVNMDFLSILEGNGSLAFYVYSTDTWGVSGAFNISMLGQGLSSGSLFVGPPGFMVEANVTMGLDLKILSGSLTYGGMFWYYKVPDPDTWGAYVHVLAKGEFLAGLFAAEAGLEGALIGSPTFVIYSVGSIKVKVCYVTVFDGSLWISVGENGFHGGKGRNEEYDQLIEDARNMADAMNQAKEQLTEALNEAQLELAKLNSAQQEAAGLALVERSGILGGLVGVIFTYNELNHWRPGNLPPALQPVYERIFGPAQESLVATRTRLEQLKNKIQHDLNNLNQLQQEVADKINQYEDILVEELPSVQELGNMGNPFQGMNEKTVNIGGTSKRVIVGFRIDENKAESQRSSFSAIREDFAKYQDAFIKQAGLIDAKLQQLDEILFQNNNNLTQLTRGYANAYSEIATYVDSFVEFQGKNYKYADESIRIIQSLTNETQIREALSNKAQQLSQTQLQNWNNDRIQLIQSLLQVGKIKGETEEDTYNPPEGINPQQLFVETGDQLWWTIPMAGFRASKEHSLQRRAQTIATFRDNTASFRTKWASVTSLVDRIYEKKSQMYDVLYEIYDQLAIYGSGEIGIATDGNVAGIGGLSGLGLAFRSSAVANTVKQSAFQLPAGLTTPTAPVIGPLRPIAPPQNTPPGGNIQSQSIPGQTGIPGSPAITQTGKQLSTPHTGTQPGITYTGISLGITIDRDLTEIKIKTTPTAWVAVTTYFRAKRDEIQPYLAVPSVESFSGSVVSTNQFTALLSAYFSGEHPVGVVEYEYKLEPVGETTPNTNNQTTTTASQNTTSSVSQTGIYQFALSTSLKPLPIYIPWFSLGNEQTLREPFFSETNLAGNYYLYLKIRGAGGKSIVRRATLNLRYFNPDTDSQPVSSNIDTSDNTPPSKPSITLEGPYTFRTDKIYAKWRAEDLESGIQGYEYSVGTHTAKTNTQSVGVTSPGVGVMTSTTLDSLAGTAAGISLNPTTQGQNLSEVATDVLPWQNAGGRTEANIRGLNLEHGKSYVVNVRATNGVGLKSIGTSLPILVDTTPPEGVSISLVKQVKADAHANSIRFEFDRGNDPESGIESTLFSVGTGEGIDDILKWQEAKNNLATLVNIPASEGTTIYVNVKSTNGAGLESVAHKTVVMHYSDSTEPETPLPVTFPPHFTSDVNKLSFGWNEISDEESGVVEYAYGIGTTPYYPDVTPWSSISVKYKPYLLGQGASVKKEREQRGTTRAIETRTGQMAKIKGVLPTYYVEKENLQLESGKTYYILVRATNGANLTSTGVSQPIVVDTTPPENVSLEASEYSTSQDSLSVTIKGEDPESGITAYRFAVWTVKETSMNDQEKGEHKKLYSQKTPAEGEAEMILVSGFVANGSMGANIQTQGNLVPGSQTYGAQSSQVPPWVNDIDLWGEPWFESNWTEISSGAPPQSIDIRATLTGFPIQTFLGALFGQQEHSLAYGRSYRVKVWIKNGAGLTAETNPVIIKVVKHIPPKTKTLEGKTRTNTKIPNTAGKGM